MWRRKNQKKEGNKCRFSVIIGTNINWYIGIVKEDCFETKLYNSMEEKGEIKRGRRQKKESRKCENEL